MIPLYLEEEIPLHLSTFQEDDTFIPTTYFIRVLPLYINWLHKRDKELAASEPFYLYN